MGIDERLLARQYVYSFLACIFSDPLRKRFQIALQEKIQSAAEASANLLSAEIDVTSVINELNSLSEPIWDQYQNVFGLTIGNRAPAHETEYCPTDITYRSQQIADVAGFYEAFRFETNPFEDEPERPDHIALELGFMGVLAAKEILADSDEKIQICRSAQKDFFSRHIWWWTPGLAHGMKDETARGLYSALADALYSFVSFEYLFLELGDEEKISREYSSHSNASPATCNACPFNSE